jgi:hypothetical protein
MKKEDSTEQNWSRRNFLRTMGAGVPTLSLMGRGVDARDSFGAVTAQEPDKNKFSPLDLRSHFNCSSSDFGARPQAKGMGGESARDGLIRAPGGDRNIRGIPFQLGPENIHDKRWLVLSTRPSQNSTRSVRIPLQQRAGFLCIAAFCDWDKNENAPRDAEAVDLLGQRLGEVVLVYEGGTEKRLPMRRRFEVSSPLVGWGHLCFAALAFREEFPRRLTDPLADGEDWGRLQMAMTSNSDSGPWICALPNPDPERQLTEVKFEATCEDPLVVCGLTLFHGKESPLRQERLSVYRFTLPEATAENKDRWKISVDLGVIARSYAWNRFESNAWLSSPEAGLGERFEPIKRGQYLYAEVTASRAATLTLHDLVSGRKYNFELGDVVPGRELEARPGGARLEILETEKTWVHANVVDAATGRPTPVRLAFRSRDGRYIPPYGHRTEINDGWFQDYGADLKLGDASFAYVDGTFQVELPVGEVYVEMTKGYEYQAVRKKLEIRAGQRELNLEIPRLVDLRAKGWVSADTHVHFVSPTTGVLEGQAEGLNLINILAAQWGELFTNVGDVSYGPLASKDGEMIVWVGSENRQHILGHIGMLGVHGNPVFPMSASGPEESYLGDPLWSSLAEWADTCREREGLAVGVHFPYPTGEVAADIIMGKLDALELWPGNDGFNTLRCQDWYRYLNCGYRLPVVGGTDKMGAYEAVGANRAYVHLGDAEFNFGNWAKAVRNGNTFMTTGPLLLFAADGHAPGGEIKFSSGGGKLEVEAHATCFFPIHRLEVVFNGRVVASREEAGGARELSLKDEVQVPGPGWIAARCSSRYRSAGTGQVPGKLAHTSPVYIVVPGQELFSPPAAAYFLNLIDGARTWVENLATRPDAGRFEKILRLFGDARAELHRRLHQQGIEH